MTSRGQLNISAEATSRCQEACAAFARDLDAIRAAVIREGAMSGFGTLPSGIALNKKYTELTSGESGSLTSMLRGHIEIATKLADTFRRMGEQYVVTDEAVAATLHPSDTGGR